MRVVFGFVGSRGGGFDGKGIFGFGGKRKKKGYILSFCFFGGKISSVIKGGVMKVIYFGRFGGS